MKFDDLTLLEQLHQCQIGLWYQLATVNRDGDNKSVMIHLVMR